MEISDLEENIFAEGPREVCSYGESCYRLNANHLRRKKHPHLENCLKRIGKAIKVTSLPPSTVEKSALQLNILKDSLEIAIVLMEAAGSSSSSLDESLFVGDEGVTRELCRYGQACYRLNSYHLRYKQHPHLESLLNQNGNKIEVKLNSAASEKLMLQLDVLKDLLETRLLQMEATSISKFFSSIDDEDSKNSRPRGAEGGQSSSRTFAVGEEPESGGSNRLEIASPLAAIMKTQGKKK